MSLRTLAPAVLLATSLAAGCVAARTVAATQPGSPAAFDPAKSDEKAIAIADRVLTAVGGEAAWLATKEIVWSQRILHDGKAVVDGKHAWDRWNGRHRYSWPDPEGQEIVAMYELDSDVGSATVDKRGVSSGSGVNIIAEAKKRWAADTYMLFMPFKLKDPGMKLGWVEERADEGQTVAKWDVIKVTFEPGVGPSPGDTYYVLVNRETNLIDIVEHVAAGKSDEQRIGYRWDGWTDSGGLKFSTRRQNIGYAGEQIEFSGIELHASPDEDHYVPVLR